MCLVVVLAVRSAAVQDPASTRAGWRASIAAASAFAPGMGLFTILYLPSHSLPLAGMAAAVGFLAIFAVGFLVSRFVPRYAV